MGNEFLRITDLHKHYGEGEAKVEVLRGITTSVDKGEVCVLLGPSGSGKSTFLNLVGGLEPADGGSGVHAPGQNLERTREKHRREGIPVAEATWEKILAAGE